MSSRLNQEREAKLQPARMTYAKEQLQKLGYAITYEDKTRIEFVHRNEVVKLFPFSGWHSGKSIKGGRGIAKLLKQLK